MIVNYIKCELCNKIISKNNYNSHYHICKFKFDNWNKIKNLLIEGKNRFEIAKIFNIKNERIILQTVKEYNFYNIYEKTLKKRFKISKDETKLKLENKLNGTNKRNKSIKLKKYQKLKRIKRFNNINKNFGELIREEIKNGKSITDICKITKIGPIPITNYLKFYNFFENAKNNGKILNAIKAKNQFKKNAQRLHQNALDRKNALPELSNDAKGIYIDGLKNNDFAKDIKLKLKNINQFHNYIHLKKLYGKTKRTSMYGRSPSYLSGRGIFGHLINNGKKILFRSSLELSIFIYLIENNINFSLSKHRISFKYKNTKKTYNPDIIIENNIYEIKPKVLINLSLNKLKFYALKEYCNKFNLKCNYITEETYDIKNILNKNKILNLIKNNLIILNSKQKERLLKLCK